MSKAEKGARGDDAGGPARKVFHGICEDPDARKPRTSLSKKLCPAKIPGERGHEVPKKRRQKRPGCPRNDFRGNPGGEGGRKGKFSSGGIFDGSISFTADQREAGEAGASVLRGFG